MTVYELNHNFGFNETITDIIKIERKRNYRFRIVWYF